MMNPKTWQTTIIYPYETYDDINQVPSFFMETWYEESKLHYRPADCSITPPMFKSASCETRAAALRLSLQWARIYQEKSPTNPFEIWIYRPLVAYKIFQSDKKNDNLKETLRRFGKRKNVRLFPELDSLIIFGGDKQSKETQKALMKLCERQGFIARNPVNMGQQEKKTMDILIGSRNSDESPCLILTRETWIARKLRRQAGKKRAKINKPKC